MFHLTNILNFFQNTCDAEKTYEALLSFVISELSKGKLYHEEGTQECSMVCFY